MIKIFSISVPYHLSNPMLPPSCFEDFWAISVKVILSMMLAICLPSSFTSKKMLPAAIWSYCITSLKKDKHSDQNVKCKTIYIYKTILNYITLDKGQGQVILISIVIAWFSLPSHHVPTIIEKKCQSSPPPPTEFILSLSLLGLL